MTQFLISALAFIVAIGILVTVHEFGHFWVARKLGVKVLRFSIGFGKPVLGFRRPNDPTEYVISAIPLGGYVKMLDEREGEVPADERQLAFNNKPVGSRMAIVCAGPAFNILLAILVYALVFVIGITGLKPVVGGVNESSFAARAGFEAGDTIVAVNQKPVRTWQETRLAILDTAIADPVVAFDVITDDGNAQLRTVNLGEEKLLKHEGDIIESLGLRLWEPVIDPVVDEVIAGGAAERAGLKAGDTIVSANNQPIDSWLQWAEYVRQRPGENIALSVLRNGSRLELVITPEAKSTQNGEIGVVGAAVRLSGDIYDGHRVLVRYGIFDSLAKGIQKTWEMTVLSFRMIGQLIVGAASPKNISGPITIAEYAGKSASIGLSYFLDLLAIISVSLAVLNILPVPLLDGGHLLYLVVELIKGSPVSERVQLIGQNIGILILGALMSLAFYNDISRLLG